MDIIGTYRDTGVRDPDGAPVLEGTLLRVRHPKHKLKHSNHLFPVYYYKDDTYLTYDDYYVTDEYLKREHLYVFGHISSYKGKIPILDDTHIMSRIKEEQVWNLT